MATTERVTITLSETVVREIDRQGRNRTLFVQEAVQRELDRRRHDTLRTSIESPHAEGTDLAEAGFDDWVSSLPPEDTADLVDSSAGQPVRWVRGGGWAADET